jgi:hypothetical protein
LLAIAVAVNITGIVALNGLVILLVDSQDVRLFYRRVVVVVMAVVARGRCCGL